MNNIINFMFPVPQSFIQMVGEILLAVVLGAIIARLLSWIIMGIYILTEGLSDSIYLWRLERKEKNYD